MALITSYPQGAPSWADLATSDAAAAKKFYTELFGWTAEDNPAGPNMIYTIAKKFYTKLLGWTAEDNPAGPNMVYTMRR